MHRFVTVRRGRRPDLADPAPAIVRVGYKKVRHVDVWCNNPGEMSWQDGFLNDKYKLYSMNCLGDILELVNRDEEELPPKLITQGEYNTRTMSYTVYAELPVPRR